MTTNEQKQESECPVPITEMAEMFGVNVWTIRLWVDRFDVLKPCRNEYGEISFPRADVKKVETICRLTKKRGMTLEKVRKHLLAIEEAEAVEGEEPDETEEL